MPCILSMGITSFEEKVSGLLKGDVVTRTTKCVADELARVVGEPLDVVGHSRKCSHKGSKTNSHDCLMAILGKVNPLHYIVATTAEHRSKFTKIYGVPVVVPNGNGGFDLCYPSLYQTSYVDQVSSEERQGLHLVAKKKCIRKIKSIKLWTKKRVAMRCQRSIDIGLLEGLPLKKLMSSGVYAH